MSGSAPGTRSTERGSPFRPDVPETPAVACEPQSGSWRCRVTLGEADGGAGHTVTVDRATLDDLAPGATPEALVAASFDFLLEREPPGSILRTFELPIIGRYFADYPDEIRRRMAG
jgi:hypothetical protein